MIHSLANYTPTEVRFYRWNYSWPQIKELYLQKQKEVADLEKVRFDFLVELASAALGGGKSGDENEIGMDDGNLDEVSPEQITELRMMLGEEDFVRQYPEYA